MRKTTGLYSINYATRDVTQNLELETLLNGVIVVDTIRKHLLMNQPPYAVNGECSSASHSGLAGKMRRWSRSDSYDGGLAGALSCPTPK